MSRTYIGINQVDAGPMTLGVYRRRELQALREGENPDDDGYLVTYPGGHVSWSPAEVFEASYFPMAAHDRVSQEDVDAFVRYVSTTTINQKTACSVAQLVTGYEIVETSSCVDPANYDVALGEKYATEKIKSQVWELLGFVLQWARGGIKR